MILTCMQGRISSRGRHLPIHKLNWSVTLKSNKRCKKKAVRITSGWRMAQKDWVNYFFIYQAEGDVISVSIPTVVSKHEKKQWW